MRIKKRASCTNTDYKKMGNLDDKRKFQQKWRVWQKVHQGFGQIFKWDDNKWQIWQEVIKGLTKIFKNLTKEMTKRASWQMAIITEMANLAAILKVWQKLNEMTNEAHSLFAIFTKMTILVNIGQEIMNGSPKIQMRWRKIACW